MYDGINGFLPWRASIMLDVVFLAMFAVIPVMGWSIWLVRYRRNFALHKKLQLTLGLVLLVAVGFFELDMQWLTTWEKRAVESPYYANHVVHYSLWVHLVFAISTAVLWVYVIVQALRKFPRPPRPNEYGPTHIRWARIAAIDMFLTAVTGWVFYWLAFIA